MDGVIRGEARTCAGIHHRANGRTPVASPGGTTPVRTLPEERAQAHGVLAGGMRGGKGGIVQKAEHMVLRY